MDESIRILRCYAEYQWRWTPWCGTLFAIGIIAVLLVSFCKSFKTSNPWKVYMFALVTTIVFLCQFWGTAIPTLRDAKEENVVVLEGVYHGIVPSSGKGSRSREIEIELNTGIVARRYLASSFAVESFSYDPGDYFPEDGPLNVRIYCAGRTKVALYMEVIE